MALTDTNSEYDLDPALFHFQDTSGKMWAAVYIGNCSPEQPDTCSAGTATGGNSIWVGAGQGTQLPEPGTLALLGARVASLGFATRKRSRRAG